MPAAIIVSAPPLTAKIQSTASAQIHASTPTTPKNIRITFLHNILQEKCWAITASSVYKALSQALGALFFHVVFACPDVEKSCTRSYTGDWPIDPHRPRR